MKICKVWCLILIVNWKMENTSTQGKTLQQRTIVRNEYDSEYFFNVEFDFCGMLWVKSPHNHRCQINLPKRESPQRWSVKYSHHMIIEVGWPNQNIGRVQYTDRPVHMFSKLNEMFFGYFDPIKSVLDSESNQFSGWPNRYFGKDTSIAVQEARSAGKQSSGGEATSARGWAVGGTSRARELNKTTSGILSSRK